MRSQKWLRAWLADLMDDMARAIFLGLMIASSMTDKITTLMTVSVCGFSLALVVGALYLRVSTDQQEDESDPKN
jgi:hypothetical protein